MCRPPFKAGPVVKPGSLIRLNCRTPIICHVLIIEDEPFFAMDLQNLLEIEGASSFEFADTQADAITSACARRPAVITSDVHLYEGRGPAAVAEIRSLLGHIPVIFITATLQDCDAMRLGDALLNKPVDRQILRDHFRRMRS